MGNSASDRAAANAFNEAIGGIGKVGAKLKEGVEGGISNLTAKLAFHPPPASYFFQKEPSVGALQMWMRTGASEQDATLVSAPGFSAFFLRTSTGNRIPAYIFEVPKARFTILYSHSNATDIGIMNDLCRRLTLVLHVNVMAYEYTGYSCSTGRPSETETYADIRAAMAFLMNDKGIPSHRIILYGQSIGSGPTIDLAALMKEEPAGVVIHSGITSGARVINPALQATPRFDMFPEPNVDPPPPLAPTPALPRRFDIFPNIDKIAAVRCPVLCIHGVADEEVKIEHGIQLNRSAANPFPPLWLDGGHHNDIEFTGRRIYIQKLLDYLEHIEVAGRSPRHESCVTPALTSRVPGASCQVHTDQGESREANSPEAEAALTDFQLD